jgi:anti-sigma factor RsiW
MQLDRQSHASDETLESYAMGSLAGPALAEVEEHLLVCPHCQEQLKDVDSYVTAMRSAAAGLEVKDESRKELWTRVSTVLTFRRIGWAVAIAALLVLGVSLRLSWRSSPSAQPLALVLETNRGSELQRAPAGRPLTLSLDATGLPVLPAYDVEAVDAKGAVQAQFHAVTGQSGIKIQLAEGLRRGNYFVRIYSPSRELLREYGVQVD